MPLDNSDSASMASSDRSTPSYQSDYQSPFDPISLMREASSSTQAVRKNDSPILMLEFDNAFEQTLSYSGERQESSTDVTSIGRTDELTLEFGVEHIMPVAKSAFGKIDSDKDGFLSLPEVEIAMTDDQFKGKEAVFVSFLKSELHSIQKFSNDEIGLENDGATVGDMEELARQYQAYDTDLHDAWTVKEYGTRMFDDIDSNHDGKLDNQEVDSFESKSAENEFDLSRQEQALEQMRSNFEVIQGANDDGITREGLQTYYDSMFTKHNWSALSRAANAVASGVLKLYENNNHSLYKDSDRPLDSISPTDIEQGKIGDCYLLAPLASLAGTPQGREKIAGMIEDNGVNTNGTQTYTVTFPGAPDRPITVAAPTESELAYYAAASKGGYWPAVLEKAYGTYLNNASWFPSTNPQDAADGGSAFNAGIEILSENGLETKSFEDLSGTEIVSIVRNNLASGKPLTVSSLGTWSSLVGGANEMEGLGLPRNHEFGITGFDEKTCKVTLYNPWGEKEPENSFGKPRDGEDDGVFQLTLEELKTFDKLAFGR